MAMHPEHALRMQADLLSELRSSDWAVYAENFAVSMFTKNDPELSPTYEETGEWSGEAHNKYKGQGRHLLSSMSETLSRAETFVVDKRMNPLIRMAAADWPDEMVFEPHMVPSESGFLVFEQPWEMTDIHERTLSTKAIVWRVAGGRVAIWQFNSWAEPDWYTERARRNLDPDALRRIISMGDLGLHHMTFLPFGKTLADFARSGWTTHQRDSATEPARAIAATWALMQQTIVSVDAHRMTPKRQQGWKKKKIPGKVSVITLRHRSQPKEFGEQTERVYEYRWVVRGHWRHQPYGTRANPEYKWIYIHPHLKGPEDAPLKETKKVNVLRR